VSELLVRTHSPPACFFSKAPSRGKQTPTQKIILGDSL
jgi:hypothetical protein